MKTSEIKKLLAEHRNIEFTINNQTLTQRKDSMLGSKLSISWEYASWKYEQGTLDKMVKKFVPRIKRYQKRYPNWKVKVNIKNDDWVVTESYEI